MGSMALHCGLMHYPVQLQRIPNQKETESLLQYLAKSGSVLSWLKYTGSNLFEVTMTSPPKNRFHMNPNV